MEMNIIKKEPKYSLYECLNDCTIEMLEFLFEVHKSEHTKKMNTKKEYVDYLNKKIKKEFRKYLDYAFKYSAYKILTTDNKDNYYNDELALNGFMFHYHYEEPDKECLNIVPKEILEIFRSSFTQIQRERYLEEIVKRYISNYLLATGYIPKSKLKEFVLNLKDIKITEEQFEKIIKDLGIKNYKNNYTMLPNELCEIVESYKLDYPYNYIGIMKLEDYSLMFNKLINDILAVLNIEEKNKFMCIITLSLKICMGYQLIGKAGEEIQREFDISEEKLEQINDLIIENKSEIRFWNVNGSTNEEYHSYNFIQKGMLKSKTEKNDIKTCLKEISEEGKELIRIYYDIKSNEIEDIKNEILRNMEDVLNDYDDDYLENLLKLNRKPYSKYIYSDFLFSGLLYLYSENDEIKVLISDEAKKGIENIIKNNNNRKIMFILTNRYLKENGVISIEKLLKIFNDEHHLNATEETIMDIIEEQGVPIRKKKYLSFSPTLTDDEVEAIIRKKEMIAKQHIINLEEPDYCQEFLDEVDSFTMYMPIEDKNIINSYLLSMIFFGRYRRKDFQEVLKQNHLEKHINALDAIATKYKDNVGIWTLNGFNKKQFEQNGKEPKIGRNDPCLCGSGLKYKKCCGK